MPRQRLPVRWMLAASLTLTTGCSIDQTDLVFLSIESPVALPALAAPSDSLRRPRLSLSVTRPSIRVREGFLDNNQPNVDWPIDSISGPDGVSRYALKSRGANNAAMRWDLPSWQGSLSLEFPLDARTVVGIGAQGSGGPSGTQWFAEGRLGLDASTQTPLRFSLGGFVGNHEVRAAYLRRVDSGPSIVSWANNRQETVGFFADLVLIPSAFDRPIVPILGVTYVRERLLRHRVPSPEPSHGAVDVNEWMTLWGVSLAVRTRMSSSMDLVVGARLAFDPTIEYAGTAAILLPLVQLNVHF